MTADCLTPIFVTIKFLDARVIQILETCLLYVYDTIFHYKQMEHVCIGKCFTTLINIHAGQFIFYFNGAIICSFLNMAFNVRPKKKCGCLRSPDPPYFSAVDPNLFYRKLFDPNFCQRPYQFLHRIQITIFVV